MTEVPVTAQPREAPRRSWFAQRLDEADFVDLVLTAVLLLGVLGTVLLLLTGREPGFLTSVVTLTLGFLVGRNMFTDSSANRED